MIFSLVKYAAVMQTEGFEYLKVSCPSILTELLRYVAKRGRTSAVSSAYAGDELDGTDANGRRVRPRNICWGFIVGYLLKLLKFFTTNFLKSRLMVSLLMRSPENICTNLDSFLCNVENGEFYPNIYILEIFGRKCILDYFAKIIWKAWSA